MIALNIFLVSINIIVPLCIFCLIGYFSHQWHWVSSHAYEELNRLVYKLLLPCVIFYSAYHSDFHSGFPIGYIGYGVGSILIIFTITLMCIALSSHPQVQKGVIIQAIVRSNFVILGLPVIQSVYGQHIGNTAILLSFVVPLFNLLSVVALEMYSSVSVNYLQMIGQILKNPLIIGSVLGVIANLLQLPLPAFLSQTLSDLNFATMPLALIALGGTFHFQAVKKNHWILSYVTALRLFLLPFVFTGLAVMLGFRGVELLSLFIAFGSPTAVASNSMAQEMNGDSELAGQIIFATTVLSAFSFFFWITLMESYRLL